MNLKIIIILTNNPFCSSSASANRWLALIEGLAFLQVRAHLIVCGGFISVEEIKNFGNKGVYKNISYEYIRPIVVQGYWKVRYHNYIGQVLRNGRILKELQKRLSNESGIIWTDASPLSYRFAEAFKRTNPQAKLFIEMSEFLDIHQYK